ncbi:MAG: alpha-1,6-glucosidase domain-containing protein [Anaerolineae bacterium]
MRSPRNNHRRTILSLLVALALLVAVLPFPQPISAATYRNWVAQVPSAPTSADTVRVWMDSDTVFGETAGLQYNVGSNYVLVLGTYDNTSYPGANWYADIPAQSIGTFVRYQLFTRNQSGSDYGWTGFNWSYTVAATPGPLVPSQARAMWLDTNTIAWNGVAGSSYKLLYDPDGGMTTAAESTACSFSPTLPSAPCYVPLTTDGTVSGFPKNPNATGKIRLLTGLAADDAKYLLKGQVVVASYDSGGARVDATRVQAQSVLDDLYVVNGTADDAVLGVTYSGGAPSVRVWAPTAKAVTLKRYATAAGAEVGNHPMALDPASGVWSVTGDSGWDRQFYLFDVQVYVPSVDAVVNNLVSDPYAVSLSQDGAATFDVRSQFVNLADPDLKPAGWDSLAKPALVNFEDSVIYEVHVRDFSANDSTVAAGDRGTYKAFTYDGSGGHPNAAQSDGMNHLKQLQQAGLTHIHLLPAFDIASVIEPVAERSEPTVLAAPRDSSSQQAAVGGARATDSFNWGYDPFHYGVPEGSYATDSNGAQRILEFRDMVSALNQNGLRVVMDVVYNHTAASGQGDKSVLDRVVPGYYYRYDANGALYTTSCCDDTATEYEMMEKLMIDTVVRFAVDYKVDGFRFDLMNFHTRQNMLNLKAAVNAVDPKIYLYGEGWTFGSAQQKGFTTCPNCFADKYNMTGAGIGLFNDIIRDAAHGGYSEDTLQIRKQGFINGLSYDWNGYEYANRLQSNLHSATDRLRSALRGSGADWNGQGSPFTDDPQEAVNYVEKHDNETLFDQNVFKLPSSVSMAERVRSQNMGVSIVGLAQGVPFLQMGQDILRSKSLDRNSYDSGDWFNRVWWDRSRNNFGSGLPPSWDNSTRWGIMGPLLANTALDPTTADMNFAAAHLRETLRIRNSSPLFRLTTEADINARVGHYNSSNTQDALIVMRLSDEPAPDLDANWENILVFFNANKVQQTFTIPGANGFSLHPLHTNGVDDDPVITTASFNDATDTFTIPARTTVVFVSTQTLTPPAPPSTIDWVGRMWPRGGVSHPIDQGAFGPSGFEVYVQVYEPGITGPGGSHSDLICYLHWGKFGVPWSDVPMTFNTVVGNNDEHIATISQATLNALPPGTYGFNAYCQKPGEEKKWKIDLYDIDSNPLDDDQGDGLITIIPALDSSVEPTAGVFVHLFEWRWADIEKECTFLADKGYTAVQVSPPNEHLVPTADQGGQSASDYPWWARYQPVTHLAGPSTFTSRSGTWAEFTSMVSACDALGVGVYVDAVINHMADIQVGSPPAGTAGTQYQSTMPGRFYGPQYQADDFHSDCTISNYGDRRQVQQCKLSGLPDLNTGKSDVQSELHTYLQALLTAGVKGFRVDGAKHMAAQDIAAIFNGLTGNFYVFQEMIDAASERVRDWEYTPNGDVTEFAYPYAIGAAFDDACTGSLSDLQNRFSQPDMLPSRFAQVFSDNHDNQRGHGVATGQCIVDHRDGQEHVLANIFALAYPYGHPSVMSSYYWQNDATNNSNDSYGPPTVNGGPGSSGATLPVFVDGDNIPDNCAGTYTWGKWACEHRRTSTANMVKFRQVTAGQPIVHWQNIGNAPTDHIAFGLGDKGFVAINRTGSSAVTTYQTGMAAGSYCDITKYDYIPSTGQCIDPVTTVRAPADAWVVVNSSGQIVNKTLDAMDAFAIYAGGSPLAVTLASFQAGAQADHVLVSWETVSEIGNRGFNLYRGTAPAGPDRRLNEFLIPSQSPGSTAGFAYAWEDRATLAVGTTYYYWLEALDEYGATTLHGPVSVVYAVPTAVTVSALQADGARTQALPASLALLAAGVLAGAYARRKRTAR